MIKLEINHRPTSERGIYALFRLLAVFAAATLLFLPSCRPSRQEQMTELEARKKQWIAEMKEAFPEQTSDTVELRKRLIYYQETGNKVGEQMMYRVLGTRTRDFSKFRQAIEYHTAGLQVAYEIYDTMNITYLLNELGTDFRRIGAFNEAAPYYYLSLQIAEGYNGRNLDNVMRNMASSYNGLGSIYRAMNEHEEALEVYEKALGIYEKALDLETKSENYRGVAINYSNIGAVWFDRGDYEKAEEYYRISLENNEKAKYKVGTALCHINIGRVYEKTGRLDDALAEALAAYKSMEGSSDKWRWLEATYKTGDIYTQKGEYDKARRYLEDGLKTAIEIQSLTHIYKGYELLSEYNFARGNYKLAAEQMMTTKAYADTIERNREVDRLMESRVKYETERYAKQITELDEQNRVQETRRRNTLLLMIPIILGLLILLFLILYKRRLERRQVAELKNLERMRSNFFTNITHEFRTPITVINGLSDHLQSAVKDEDSPEAKDLEAIRRQGRHLMHLVNQLLDFSRSEAGVNKPKWRYGDLVEYLNVVAEPYAQYARNKDIDLFIYSEVESLPMNFIASSVKKVMGNLLSNAIKHCSPSDKIIVHLNYDEPSHRCTIQVRDSGSGIAPEHLPHIFELYYTSDAENTGHVGSGIGLALTKQLVEEAGGTIGVTSTPGKGTEFTISLPVSRSPIPEDEREELGDDEPDITAYDPDCDDDELDVVKSNGKKTILIVEDNKDVVHYMNTILKDKYTLLHAANGNEGLLMAEQHIPDLIITDVMMPEKDGYAFTADLRASVAVSHIPVIMITAKGTTEDRLEGFKAGADAYLPKPFDERELLVRIKQLLDSRAMLMETYANALFGNGKADASETDLNMAFITKLSSEVNSHLDEAEYFPTGLAQDMCLSESQLARKLKAMTGHTISSFVMQARLNKAKLMLSRHDRSIKEVALACGFSDLSYFSRSFRKAFGYTPSQFVKIPEQNPEK